MQDSNIEDWVWFYYDKCKFSIIPIKEKDKRPNIKSWEKYKNQRPTKQQIKKWLKENRFKNIGIIGGAVSDNLVCFDIDDPKAVKDLGIDVKKYIEQGAWVVETPKQKGRYHIIVRDKETITVTRQVKQDIDKRANGHYWVVYPSIHPNGNQYNLLNTKDIKKLDPPIKVDSQKMFDDWISKLYKIRGIKETLQDTVKTKNDYDSSPDCIRNAWELGADPGGRYYTAVGLGSWLQQQKFPLEMSKSIVAEWFKNKCKNDGRPIDDIKSATEVGYKGQYETGCNWWRENTDFCPFKEKNECHFILSKKAKLFNTLKQDIKESENIKLEPILNSETPKWLAIENNGNGLTFSTLEENLWHCNKCGGQLQSNDRPFFCNECNQDSSFNQITKSINLDRWKLPHWKDIPVEDINMIEVYYEILDLIKDCIVFPDDIQYDLFALWIIASYKMECFDTTPFLIFRGLIESGKTRGLDILRELGYRMVHTTGVSFPALCRLSHFHSAGVLIDEIDNKINAKFEDGRKYLDFLKPSYRRGSTYTCADNNDQEETITYKNYGFKAFAGETGGYDQAIFSRSIDFQMQQDYPNIPDLRYCKDRFDNLQNILLNYRYKFKNPEELDIDYPLRGRDREIFSSLIQTADHIGIGSKNIVKYVVKRKKEKQEEIEDTDEYQILSAIKCFDSNETLDDAPEIISYTDLIEQMDWDDDKRKRLGFILRKKLLLKTKRKKNGYVILMNEKKNIGRLKMLYRRYNLC